MKLSLFLAFAFCGFSARADLVVSIRYFKAEGVSHYHLFLYRDDGRLIRQLTSPEKAHDVGPKFSNDGRTIFFTRMQGNAEQAWRVGVDGNGLQRIGGVPAKAGPGARQVGYEQSVEPKDLNPAWEIVEGGFRLAIPHSKDEVILRQADVSTFGDPTTLPETRAFQALTIREAASGKETRVATDHGMHDTYCDWLTLNGTPFLRREGLAVAFYSQHMGSTHGFRVAALDLLAKREVPLTEMNPTLPVPHGTRAGFFSVCQERYQPLPGTAKTVNCLYLDWWDKDFKRVRFSRELSLFGGASVRVKGQPPLDLPFER